MKLYRELAPWFHLLTAPEDYAEEAKFYRSLLCHRVNRDVHRVLELGSGGGNNAFHLQHWFQMTLVDISPGMLAQSQRINPRCEHIVGDMRSLRLDRQFDAVFVHDAVMYMRDENSLRAAMQTAVAHCRPQGIILLVPDCTRESFVEYAEAGGHADDQGRSLTYRATVSDPDPHDSTYQIDFQIVLRENNGEVRHETDQHCCGLFSQQQWIQWLAQAGCDVEAVAVPKEITGDGPSTVAIHGVVQNPPA